MDDRATITQCPNELDIPADGSVPPRRLRRTGPKSRHTEGREKSGPLRHLYGGEESCSPGIRLAETMSTDFQTRQGRAGLPSPTTPAARGTSVACRQRS